MKHRLLNGIACSSWLVFALAAGNVAAQTYHDDDNWHRARESYFTGDNWRMHLFERVRADLDHVQTDAFAGSDQYRIVQTKQQVAELQAKLTEGRYDQPELDEVCRPAESNCGQSAHLC